MPSVQHDVRGCAALESMPSLGLRGSNSGRDGADVKEDSGWWDCTWFVSGSRVGSVSKVGALGGGRVRAYKLSWQRRPATIRRREAGMVLLTGRQRCGHRIPAFSGPKVAGRRSHTGGDGGRRELWDAKQRAGVQQPSGFSWKRLAAVARCLYGVLGRALSSSGGVSWNEQRGSGRVGGSQPGSWNGESK